MYTSKDLKVGSVIEVLHPNDLEKVLYEYTISKVNEKSIWYQKNNYMSRKTIDRYPNYRIKSI